MWLGSTDWGSNTVLVHSRRTLVRLCRMRRIMNFVLPFSSQRARAEFAQQCFCVAVHAFSLR
eukprot:m.459586 g.459586  ORF g.459586 m.459586 type:complete len:62 (-) comp21583_c0_seq22:2784-2969(-)